MESMSVSLFKINVGKCIICGITFKSNDDNVKKPKITAYSNISLYVTRRQIFFSSTPFTIDGAYSIIRLTIFHDMIDDLCNQ